MSLGNAKVASEVGGDTYAGVYSWFASWALATLTRRNLSRFDTLWNSWNRSRFAGRWKLDLSNLLTLDSGDLPQTANTHFKKLVSCLL